MERPTRAIPTGTSSTNRRAKRAPECLCKTLHYRYDHGMALSPAPSAVRAAIYCRLSKDDAGDQLGVRRQERDCRALALRRGWEVIEVFVDDDVSAYVPGRRPSYARLLDAIRGGWIDAVLMYDLDRLHRHPWELEEFFRTCDAANLSLLASVSGDVDLGTNDGRLVARIMGAVAKKASDDTSRRLKRKFDEKATNGEPHGARPFGYEIDGVTIREDEAALIRQAAADVLLGESLNAIARRWTEAGAPTPQRAKSWSGTAVRTILTGPHQAGLRRHRGEIVGEGAWPAIIDRTTHERLVSHLADAGRRLTNPPRRQPFTGLVRCGLCGGSMDRDLVHSRKAGAGKGMERPAWATYKCHKRPGRDNCGRLSVAAEPVEALVVEAVFQRLAGPQLAEMVGPGDLSVDDDAAAEIATCEGRRTELAEMWAGGELSRAEWMSARRSLDARLDAARRRLARRSGAEALSPYAGSGDLLRTAWPELSPDQRRSILAAVIDRVTIRPASRRGRIFDPERVDVIWRA